MNVTLDPKYESFVRDKLRSGEYESAEELVSAALQLLACRDENRGVLQRLNDGEPLPVDEHFDIRLDTLLQEAEESGEPVEMTPEDWNKIRKDGLALIRSRKSP